MYSMHTTKMVSYLLIVGVGGLFGGVEPAVRLDGGVEPAVRLVVEIAAEKQRCRLRR